MVGIWGGLGRVGRNFVGLYTHQQNVMLNAVKHLYRFAES